MNVRYRVELSQAERDELAALLSGGKHSVRKLKRAQILLAVPESLRAAPGRGSSLSAAARLPSILWRVTVPPGPVRPRQDMAAQHPA